MTVNSPKRSALCRRLPGRPQNRRDGDAARTITVFSKMAMKEMDAYRSEITLIGLPSPAGFGQTEGLRGICAPLPSRDNMLACAIGWAKIRERKKLCDR